MKTSSLFAAAALTLHLAAASQPNFTGTWEFAPAKSKNVGMMAGMKLTATVRQTATELLIISRTESPGPPTETRLDLTGKSIGNETPMDGKADTVTRWDGEKLVTTWTSAGSVAGTQTVRTETRSLSPDGRLMTVESVRGKNAPIVMVYERK